MDTNIKYYHSPTDTAVIKDFIRIVEKLKMFSQEAIQSLKDDLHYVDEAHYPDGTGTPSSDLDTVGSSRFNRSDLLSLPKPTMDTAIEITATPTDTPPSDTKPDMKKMLAEKVIMMAVKLGATPETVAMLKKDCGISEDKPTETKPTVEKPKAPDDLMEMMKQMSNR